MTPADLLCTSTDSLSQWSVWIQWNGNSGMVERWNGGMDECVVSSTRLVHVGNNCIGVVAEISIMGR